LKDIIHLKIMEILFKPYSYEFQNRVQPSVTKQPTSNENELY
jgi:hypothetical protein